eukprot:2391494-Prymnesium_polylepis.1
MYFALRPRQLTAQQYVDALGLIAHPEGGYFRETFRAGSTPMASKVRRAFRPTLVRSQPTCPSRAVRRERTRARPMTRAT